jgi:hypothetical protein
MTSTGRGTPRNDDVDTPTWLVRRFIDANPHLFEKKKLRILEPCAGNGNIIRAVNEYLPDHKILWTAVEKRKACRKKLEKLKIADLLIEDFFKPDACDWSVNQFDLVLTNPPFSLAYEFIYACASLAPARAFLLRLNYLGTEKRQPWFRQDAPDIDVAPNRPGFRNTASGHTDSIEYGWFKWGEAATLRPSGGVGSYCVMDLTPLEERKKG